MAPPLPRSILQAAIRAAESRRCVSARIRQQGELFGYGLLGSGRYLEARGTAIPLLRLELRIQVGDQTSSLVQVCDGQALWSYRKLPDGQKLSRVDAVRASAELAKLPPPAGRPGGPATLPGLGGLSRLLRGLDATFQFTVAERGQLAGLPVWKLEGGWKPGYLVNFLPKQRKAIEEGKPVDLSRLPRYLPDRVIILLGQEDLFPYRIDYCRGGRGEGADGRQGRSLTTLEFFEVNLNAPVDAGQFVYAPGALPVCDETEQYLQSLAALK
ncbi:MAG: hypothetical protein ABSF26_16720 [Thermoguttaceae bacterium]